MFENENNEVMENDVEAIQEVLPEPIDNEEPVEDSSENVVSSDETTENSGVNPTYVMLGGAVLALAGYGAVKAFQAGSKLAKSLAEKAKVGIGGLVSKAKSEKKHKAKKKNDPIEIDKEDYTEVDDDPDDVAIPEEEESEE